MDNENVEFLRVKSLSGFLRDYFESFNAPFGRNFFISWLFNDWSGKFSSALENLLNHRLYVKKPLSPLEKIPARFHKMTRRLYDIEVLKNCLFPEPTPYWPRISAINLKSTSGIIASGYALDYNAASVKAFAELLEWHSFSACDDKKFIFGSWGKLKSMGAINPQLFSGFSENQLKLSNYANYRINENSNFNWLKSFSLLNKKECLVPAQLAYFGYKRLPEEPLIRQTTSNGGAAGSSWEMAVEHALCEAIERDALMIHWLNKIAPFKINLEALRKSGNDKINLLLDKYRRYNIDMTLFDITTDLKVPVILAAIRDSALGRPSLFLSTRADLDIEAAIVSSLIDGLRAGFWPSVSKKDIAKTNKKAPLIENVEERRAYWCDKKRLKETNFLFSGPVKIIEKNEYCQATPKAKLKKLKEILAVRGLDAYIADVASPIAKEFGLRVVMSLVPGLYPLYLNEYFKYLGIRRLYEAPVKMGILKNPKKEEEINLIPHPFL